MRSPRASLNAEFWTAAVCFFVSGVAALLYQVVWIRLLGLVFGHTVHAVTTVLAAYMGGLALGSFLAGRVADRVRRPLRVYALLEAAIGLYCLATPLLFAGTEALYGGLTRRLEPTALTGGVLHFVLSAVLLLPPTALMGATLPVLSRAVAGRPELPGSSVGALYAANTWGAVLGTVATGFLLLPSIGLANTVWLGVALNALVAVVALAYERRFHARAAQREERDAALEPPTLAADGALAPADASAAGAGSEATPVQVLVALAAIGVGGAASMAYEIAWTRALSLTLGSSTYAFTAMLATFLAGLALGSLVASRVLRRKKPSLASFGVVEMAIAVIVLALVPAFGALPDLVLFVLERTGVSYRSALGAQFGLSFLVMIGPTVLIGTTFPFVVAALGRGRDRLGRDVGVVYGANTIGTIFGSMVAGFVLVPAIGIRATIISAAAANLLAGVGLVAVAGRTARRARLGAVAAVAAFAVLWSALPGWDARVMTSGASIYAAQILRDRAHFQAYQEKRELLMYEEGLTTTVAVVRSPGNLSLSVNGKTDAGNGADMRTQLLLGHLGALLHPDPQRALVIGLASGVTVGALAQHPVKTIDVAELEPAMIEASRFFVAENRYALSDPRVRVLAGDGRQILSVATEPYELIVSEPSNPWIAGVASLFTREFYHAARAHLSPRGIMVQWLQTYSILPRDVQMVVRTFQEAFPHVSIWMASPTDLLLVGSIGPVTLDREVLEARLSRSRGLREDLSRFGGNPEDLLFRLFLGEEDVPRFVEGAPLNTDDRPLLEFSAPLGLYARVSSGDNEAMIRKFRTTDLPRLSGFDPVPLSGPAGRLRAGVLHWQEGRLEESEYQLSRAGPREAMHHEDRVQRARLLFLHARFEEAATELDDLVSERPEDGVARRYHRALNAVSTRVTASARAQAVERVSGRARLVPARLGQILLNLGLETGEAELFPVALEQFAAALERFAGDAAALNGQAICLAKMGIPGGAASAFQRALEITPGDARIRINLATVLKQQGRFEEAEREYAEAARLLGQQ